MRLCKPFFLAFALGLGFWTGAYAVEPVLSAIRPEGFQRGTEAEVRFQGARLTDAQELLFYSPGITVKSLAAENDGSVKSLLAIAPDCRLGIHAVRLRSATGVSNLRTFCIGALPEIAEVEPNSDFLAPQAVALGCVVNGVVQNEDVDHFVVEAKKGERISAEIEGLRLGNTTFDPYLAILNAARFELARSDDAALLVQDCVCSIVAPEDGRYIIQVRESAYGGNGACTYRLHIGKFPRPTAVIPAGGRPGETLTVRWIGDAAGSWTQQITLPTQPDDKFPLYAADAGGISPSPNLLRVIDLQNAVEAEPNDVKEQATAGVGPGAFNGIIEKPGDVDYFKFTAKAGQRFDIRVYARNTLRSPLDSVLTVLRADGAGLASNDDSGGPDSYLQFGVPADGDYFLVVQDHLKAGGPEYAYRLEVTEIKPALTMTIPEKVQYVPTTLAVPKGNRAALLIGASRANFGGELAVTFPGLPAGLAAQTVNMAADRVDIPVVFSAAADAPLGGSLAEVVGATTDPNLKVTGGLRQRTMLVRGQNNIDVWGHDAFRMATVVTQESPFSVEIVQPNVPIVRAGSMDLKVVAKRAEGFVAPINIRLLYNPPGIGSSGSVQIPQGQNEALIPMTCNDGSPIRTWPLVVVATAAVGNGTVEVSSQMAQLVVADRFFDFTFQKSAAEQGQDTEVVVDVAKKVDFAGEAKVELVGLPANTVTDPMPQLLPLTKDTTQLVFKIKVDKAARPGIYKQLLCRTVLLQNNEPITTTLGTGELRVDAPLPPKPNAPPPMPKPMPTPMPQPAAVANTPPPMPPKRLTRLEQLRLQREEEKKSAGK